MSDAVIVVNALSKAYQIGLKERHGKTFREAFTDALLSPFRRLKSIAGGGNGAGGGGEETFWALKDVSFEVKRGEVVGIIGRNGAGKSTLLKILSQITEPTSGEVRLRGRVASLLEVGTGFHPELTGRENIYLNGAILGMKRAEIARKFDEIVAFAEVEKFLDTPVKRYSSGMYVRLAFAVAAHLEPEILIVDEVLAVGDAQFQKKCLGKMQEVAQGQGRTVLFVSHNMAAVRSLCSRAILLTNGRVLVQNAVEECVRSYLAPLPLTSGGHPWNRNASMAPTTARFCKFDIENAGTDALVHIITGGRLIAHAEIDVSRDIRLACVGLNITDEDGQRVTTLWSGFHASELPLKRGMAKLCLVANSLFLRPGTYSFTLTVGDNLVAFDEVELGPRLVVEPSKEVMAPGRIKRDHGHLFPAFEWGLEAV